MSSEDCLNTPAASPCLVRRPRLVLLDRDGVVNRNDTYFVTSPGQWRPVPGSLDAVARLNAAGIAVALCTNQSGVARGVFDLASLDAIHRRMNACLAESRGRIDAIHVCPHGPDDGCRCRKPAPGMLLDAMHHFAAAPEDTCFVGDSGSDIEAAARARCASLLVRTGHGRDTENALELANARPAAVFDDLAGAVDWLLARPGAR